MELQSATIHKALHKPNLVLGAEREPILFSALIPIALSLSAFHLLMVACGVVFWIISSFFLRIMAKKDPVLTRTWIRFIHFHHFYPAKSSVWHGYAAKKKNR